MGIPTFVVICSILVSASSGSWLRGRQHADEESDAPFTIIFISDLENRYRGHDNRRSQYVVNYIRDLKNENLVFDPPYSQHVINPRLVIHGGDVSHMWSCDNFQWFILGGCRDPQDEYKDVWETLYDAKIPMVSAFGNHDWRARQGTGNPWGDDTDLQRDEESDYINRWSNEFTRLSYERSRKLTDDKLEFQEVLPTGHFGQSMYKATYAGIQIVNFNSAFNWQSYDDGGVYSADDQFSRLSQSLDRSLKTLFFSHYPLNGVISGQTPSLSTATSLIREFGQGVHHFSGHYHVERVYAYDAVEPNFNDYVAPYPHTWNGNEPGFLAILMSRTQGILQVKTINIPGLEDGALCIPWAYLNPREYFFGIKPAKDGVIGEEGPGLDNANKTILASLDLSDASQCCNRCKSGKQSWSPEACWFVCGDVE